MKIQLYPSLQFGWDIPQFQTVVREYLKDSEEEKDQEILEEQAMDLTEFEEEDL